MKERSELLKKNKNIIEIELDQGKEKLKKAIEGPKGPERPEKCIHYDWEYDICKENPGASAKYCAKCDDFEHFEDHKRPEITIELGLDKKLQIDIISKAFNMAPKEFIDFVLIKEINYVKFLLEMSNPKAELESYYEFEINIDELKKLILIEEVL